MQQLLGVLPPRSKECLPLPYQKIMTDPASPLFPYCPVDFEVDMNGKKNDWEGIVLIPFIDQQIIIDVRWSVPFVISHSWVVCCL